MHAIELYMLYSTRSSRSILNTNWVCLFYYAESSQNNNIINTGPTNIFLSREAEITLSEQDIFKDIAVAKACCFYRCTLASS